MIKTIPVSAVALGDVVIYSITPRQTVRHTVAAISQVISSGAIALNCGASMLTVSADADVRVAC